MRSVRSMGWALGVAMFALPARAEPPASLRIAGDERSCPTPSQVADFLAPLLPGTKIVAGGGSSRSDDVSLFDDGATFRVAAAGQERSFVDAVRACFDRARHAAVFIALALDPPAITEAQAPSPLAVRPPPPPAPAAVRSVAHWDLQLGAIGQMAPASSTRTVSYAGGIEARLRWGRSPHVSMGAGLLPGSIQFSTATAHTLWFPIDVAAGLHMRSGWFEGAGELGPALTVLAVTGQDLGGAERQWRLELGARAAAAGRAWISERFGFFVSTQATALARPHDLFVDPDGRVGSTPWLLWGGSIGLFSRID